MNAAAQPPERRPPLALVAIAVAAVVAVSLLISARGRLPATLGDTDDAMRLVMVRALARGEAGWFDVHVARLQPPLGLDMHWSRLVDAALAGLDRLFGLFMAPEQAEAVMRMVWPLAWLLPAVWVVLALARRFGGPSAVMPAALLLAANILLYSQWWPGRIDHHAVQITLALAAVAGAAASGVGGALLAGVATGLGLAVGLEALPILALAGASFALRFLFDPQGEARAARVYAAALLAATSGLYAAQTAPARLAATACDALAANLWAAVAVAALGLVLAVQVTRRRGPAARLAALALAGAAAGAVYVGLNPACLGGPMGEVDPRIAPIWLDHIREMQPMLARFWTRRSDFVVCTLVLSALAAAGWVWLGLRRQGRTPAWLLLGACWAASLALALDAERMVHYANWFALPLIAGALGDLTARYWKGSLIPAILLVAAFSQPALLALLGVVPGWSKPAERAKGAEDRCIEGPAMRRLAKLPPGLVLAEIDLGPRILARTPHAAVAAPYHRMSWGILAAHGALAATPGPDERAVRALQATYVVTCPARAAQMNHAGLGRRSLQQRLDRGEAPTWLEPLSGPADPLQVYRVRPVAAPRG